MIGIPFVVLILILIGTTAYSVYLNIPWTNQWHPRATRRSAMLWHELDEIPMMSNYNQETNNKYIDPQMHAKTFFPELNPTEISPSKPKECDSLKHLSFKHSPERVNVYLSSSHLLQDPSCKSL